MRTRLYCLILIATFILASTACGPTQLFSPWPAGSEPVATVVSPANTPARYPVNPGSVESNLDQLDTYRSELILDFEGERSGQSSQGRIELLREVDRSAATWRHIIEVTATIPDSRTPLGKTELYQVAGKVYMKRSDEKFWFEVRAGSPISPGSMGLLEPERLMVLPATVSTPPTFKTLNGMEVQHYRFTEADLSASALVFEQARGEAWVTIAGRQVVQYVISATARTAAPIPHAGLFDKGIFSLKYTLADINTALDISSPPLDETISASLAVLPRLPDAKIITVFPTLIEYTSAISPVSATLFYQEVLSDQGWTEGVATVFNEKATLTFSKDRQGLTIIINPDQAPEKFKVVMDLH